MTFSHHTASSTRPASKFLRLAILFVVSVLFGAACTVSSTRSPRPPVPVEPPPVGDVTRYTASWYGDDFHGKRTASGEVYDMHAMTAAHKKLPFGTRLEVTYLKTGQSAEVTVNDRGPFIWGRDLDLSYGAARRIGMEKDGVGEVGVRFLGRDMRYVKYIQPEIEAVDDTGSLQGAFTVQFGAFESRENAERLKQGLNLEYADAYIMQVRVNNRLFNRVRMGHYPSRSEALAAAQGFAYEGYTVQVFPE